MHNLFEVRTYCSIFYSRQGSIYATVKEKEGSIKIVGRKNLNRAIHDDIVVVELLPRDQWTKVEEVVVMDEGMHLPSHTANVCE